jgi:hypothetical protein
MVITPDVIWSLRGTIVQNIQCRTHPTTSGGVWLQVVLDEEPLVEEIYPDARSAASRAEDIRRELIEKGWTAEAREDKRARGPSTQSVDTYAIL